MTIREVKNIFFLFFLGIIVINCGSNKESADKINVSLQKLDNQIYIAIEKNNKIKALELLNDLIHPSSEVWKNAPTKKDTSESAVENILGSLNSVTYNTWWSIRREELRSKIFAIKFKPKKESNSNNNDNNYEILRSSENKIEKAKMIKKYLGTYVGTTNDQVNKIFKIVIDPTTKELQITYQDNKNGDVNISSYYLLKINKNLNKLILSDISTINFTINLSIKNNDESENGFVLEDKDGLIYYCISI